MSSQKIHKMGGAGGGSRVWPTPADMLADWKDYKAFCDSQVTLKSQFSQREGRFISEPVPAPITYTQLGFALWKGIAESTFYETYGHDPAYTDALAIIAGDCEEDARRKFEQGTIPTQLSGLWMSRYGYHTRTEQRIDVQTDETTEQMDKFFAEKKKNAGKSAGN